MAEHITRINDLPELTQVAIVTEADILIPCDDAQGAPTIVTKRVSLATVRDHVGMGGSNRQMGMDDLGNVTGATAVDFTTGSYYRKKINLTGNITLSVTVAPAGITCVLFAIGNGFAITWPANIKAPGGGPPQPISDGSMYVFTSDGTNLYL